MYGWYGEQSGKTTTAEEDFISFRARRIYRKVHDSEKGRDDGKDIILIPNLILMSGMLTSEVQAFSDFLKQSVIWHILQSTGRKSPVLRMSVEEFLWGYEVI